MRKKSLKHNFPVSFARLAPMAALVLAPALAFGGLEIRPKEVGASIDLGQIKNGEIGGADAENQILTRTGVYLTGSGVYDKRLDIRVTMGGLFWYPLPEFNSPERIV